VYDDFTTQFEFTTYHSEDPVDREVYQIFLNIWENGKAFREYWATSPLSGEVEVCSEVPRKVQSTRGRKAKGSGKKLHLSLPRSTSKKTSMY
jgi:hypothetical protein